LYSIPYWNRFQIVYRDPKKEGKVVPSVTIRDVAREAGVGVGTVSRVLNNSDSVSASTREKVQAAITQLNFFPSVTARRLSLGKTQTIAVVLPFFTWPSYVERLRGLDVSLVESGYDLVLYSIDTPSRRDDVLEKLIGGDRVDGVIIMTLGLSDAIVARFLNAGIAVVLVDSFHPELPSIGVDDVLGGYEATRHLIELGHRRIAFIGDYMENDMGFRSVEKRFVGYYQALEEADLPFSPAYHQQGPHGRRSAQKMARALLQLAEPPTAIFVHSDTMAIGAIEAAQQLGLEVPGDLSVVGYDDIDVAELLRLTTVRQQLYESGHRAGQLLLEHLAGRPFVAPLSITLPVELVVRQTTAPPRQQLVH